MVRDLVGPAALARVQAREQLRPSHERKLVVVAVVAVVVVVVAGMRHGLVIPEWTQRIAAR